MSSAYKPVYIQDVQIACPLGNAVETHTRLLNGDIALIPVPVLGTSGDECPLALMQPFTESSPPRWWQSLTDFAATLPPLPWGTPSYPVIVTGSNFGIDGIYAYSQTRDPAHIGWSTAHDCTGQIRTNCGWGPDITILSHACVSAQLGLQKAAEWLQHDFCQQVLVFSYDFVGPFVAGGFHALKILNAGMPRPYQIQKNGSIGLGDGMAWAVVSRKQSRFRIEASSCYNEMYHFTSNDPSGAGFHAAMMPLQEKLRGRKAWIKGHGTGTLESGRLEAEACERIFPSAPLVSWKGSIGHTLGSCALVELGIAVAAIRHGHIPGTVGSTGPYFAETVQSDPFPADAFQSVILFSNAFGGAHAGMLLSYD